MKCQNKLCKREIGDVSLCPYCGTKQENLKFFCVHCGEEMDKDAFFCFHCEEESYAVQNLELKDKLTFVVNGVSFKMILVECGEIWMDRTVAHDTDFCHERLSDYYLGETLVTQELWYAIMGDNPSQFQGRSRPVEMVSWYDCLAFIDKLNAMLKNQLDGRQFQLPTEAQWEYAARGGRLSLPYEYAGGDNIDDVAWFERNSSRETHEVKEKAPNAMGLYDMSGNVWEWCSDRYLFLDFDAQKKPKDAESDIYRVIRGGSWSSSARYCGVSYRDYALLSTSHSGLGLRLAL